MYVHIYIFVIIGIHMYLAECSYHCDEIPVLWNTNRHPTPGRLTLYYSCPITSPMMGDSMVHPLPS